MRIPLLSKVKTNNISNNGTTFFKKMWLGKKSKSKKYSKNIFNIKTSELQTLIYGVIEDVPIKYCQKLIFNKCIDAIGRDFYYSYHYDEESKLRFIAFNSKRYADGMTPVFAHSLIQHGVYIYEVKEESAYYIFDTTEGVSIRRKKYPTSEELDLPRFEKNTTFFKKIPKSIHLRWSLRKDIYSATFFSAFVLIILAVSGWIGNIISLNQIRELNNIKIETKEIESKTSQLPNIFNTISQVESALQELGNISKITKQNTNLVFEIKFKDQSRAQLFQKKLGGNIEGDKVVYSARAF